MSGPLSATDGGRYRIEICDNVKDRTVRGLDVELDPNENAISARGGDRLIVWSPKSDYADISLGGVGNIRVYTP